MIHSRIYPSKASVGVGEKFDLILEATSDEAIHGLFGMSFGLYNNEDMVQIPTSRSDLTLGTGMSWAQVQVMDQSPYSSHEAYPDNAVIINVMAPFRGSIQMGAGVPTELVRVTCTALALGDHTLAAVDQFVLEEPWAGRVWRPRAMAGPPDFPVPNTELPMTEPQGTMVQVVEEISYHPFDVDRSGTYSAGDLAGKLQEMLDSGIVSDPMAFAVLAEECMAIFEGKGQTI